MSEVQIADLAVGTIKVKRDGALRAGTPVHNLRGVEFDTVRYLDTDPVWLAGQGTAYGLAR